MIGVFIGSFNPPTLAHFAICKKLKKRFKKIILVPVNSRDKKLIDIQDRINMLRIFTSKSNYLEISFIMKNYSYLNYRIIDLLKKEYGDIVIIMGDDLLDKLDTFDEYNYLLKNYNFCVITRDNNSELINEKYLEYKDKFTIVKFNNSISSTMARDYLKKGMDTKNILDKDIFDYIKRKDLY